jgi:FkbM family methyltransferase
MMAVKQIALGGRSIAIEGDEGDYYFRALENFAPQCVKIGEMAAAEAGAGELVLDVGANIGLTTVALALAAPRARVVAFEPSPVNLAFLRRNLAANGLERVEVVGAALSDRPGKLRFHEAKGFGAGSHVVGADHLDTKAATVEVRAVTLDRHFRDDPATIRFIKLDCEGHEPEVIFGARRRLGRDQPVIAMEFNSWTLNGCAGHSPAAFAAALWQHFEIRGMLANDALVPSPGSPYAFLHTNLTQHGCVSDLVLKPKRGMRYRALTDLTLPPSLRALLKDPPEAAPAAAPP